MEVRLYFDKSEVAELTTLSETVIDEEIKQGRFPKPRQLAGRRVIDLDLNERFDQARMYSERELPEVTGIDAARLRRLIAKGQFPAPGESGWSGAELRRWEDMRLRCKPWKPGRRRSEDTELYRHFDSRGRLLYVGIALSTPQRLKGHRFASGWFKQVVTITIERFPSRYAAEQAERKAIRSEQPLHNIAHAKP